MRCSFPVLVRLVWSRPPVQRKFIYANSFKTPKRFSSIQAHQDLKEADMGKEKVQFQLKTPKGTKDCTVVLPPMSQFS